MYDNIPRIKKREIFIQTSISHFMKCQKWILILFYENTNFEPSGKFYFFEKGMKKREFQGGQRAEMEKVEKMVEKVYHFSFAGIVRCADNNPIFQLTRIAAWFMGHWSRNRDSDRVNRIYNHNSPNVNISHATI